MAKMILQYMGKATRNVQAEQGVARVQHGQEVMVDQATAGQLLAMNGMMMRRGEPEIMWIDKTPGQRPAAPPSEPPEPAVAKRKAPTK